MKISISFTKILFFIKFLILAYQRRIIEIESFKPKAILFARETIYKYNNEDPENKKGDIIIQLEAEAQTIISICVSQDLIYFNEKIDDSSKIFCQNLTPLDFRSKVLKEVILKSDNLVNKGKGIYYIQIKVQMTKFSLIRVFNKNEICNLDIDKPNIFYFYESYSTNYILYKVPKLTKKLNLFYEYKEKNLIEIYEGNIIQEDKKIYSDDSKLISSVLLEENKEYIVKYTISSFNLNNYIVISFLENSTTELKEEGLITNLYSVQNTTKTFSIDMSKRNVNEVFYLYIYGAKLYLTIETKNKEVIFIKEKYTILPLEKKFSDENLMTISFGSIGEVELKLLPKVQLLENNKKENVSKRKTYFYKISNNNLKEKNITGILYSNLQDSLYIFKKNKNSVITSEQTERIYEVKYNENIEDYYIFLYGENDFSFEYYLLNSNSRNIEIINNIPELKIKNRKMKEKENLYFLFYTDYNNIPFTLFPFILYGEVEYFTNKENEFSIEKIYNIKETEEIQLNYYREIPNGIQFLHIKSKYNSEFKLFLPLQITYDTFNALNPTNQIIYANEKEEIKINCSEIKIEIELDENQKKQEIQLYYDNQTQTINKQKPYEIINPKKTLTIKIIEGNIIIKLLPNPKYNKEYILDKPGQFKMDEKKINTSLIFVFPKEKKQTVRAVIKSNFPNITNKMNEGYMSLGVYPFFAHDYGYATQDLIGYNDTIYISNPYRKPGKKLKEGEVYYYMCSFKFEIGDLITYNFENENSNIILLVILIFGFVVLGIVLGGFLFLYIRDKLNGEEFKSQKGISLSPQNEKYEPIN